MLFPSPVSGRGSRLFSLVHVLVHLTSCILSIALLAEGLDHANNNSLNNDGTALVLSTLFLIAGVVTTLWLSLSSVKRVHSSPKTCHSKPSPPSPSSPLQPAFENHGLVLGAMLWCFLVALALKARVRVTPTDG